MVFLNFEILPFLAKLVFLFSANRSEGIGHYGGGRYGGIQYGWGDGFGGHFGGKKRVTHISEIFEFFFHKIRYTAI